MQDYALVYSGIIKSSKDYYLAGALVYFFKSGRIEYCADIQDGNKPKSYIDLETFYIVSPPGHSKTIVNEAESWADALEQIQGIANEYGTLSKGAAFFPLVYTEKDDSEDE